MVRFQKLFSKTLCFCLLFALSSQIIFALPLDQQTDKKAEKADKKEKRKNRREQKADAEKGGQQDTAEINRAPASGAALSNAVVDVISDQQSKIGDLIMHEGYVNATFGDMRLQADRVTVNNVTGDMVAEGNVIFDQGADQRVTARRAEINYASRRGVFWDTTGFTNRTQTGEYVYFAAERVEKTGPQTYELFNASITACEDVVPKWRFTARRAEVKMDDRIKLRGSVFHVKSVPVFVLPFAWIPATRTERKSGFLLPTTGTSNQKGRTLKTAYYQTLGQSADITIRNDIYTERGIGLGAEFRAQTDEKSFMRLGAFTVKDRLFGAEGEDQGGTAFVAEAVQYLPRGWLAVGSVSLVTSLQFRQVFSDDISQVVDPRRESTFYINNNTGNVSFNLLASNETTRIFSPASDQEPGTPITGTDFDIKVRQAPEMALTVYPRRVLERFPIYFSLDSSLGALKREETVDDNRVLITPATVQRFDLQPKITIPLATFAGVAVTPSLTLRETFYTSSRDPRTESFDPDQFTIAPTDPRLNPSRPEFNPDVKLFDLNSLEAILPQNISRHYAELAVDIRPPALEKVFLDQQGASRFKHVIEPYITYRLIGGAGDDFDEIIRFDERDAVANTNEIEYAVVNRFFTKRSDFNSGGRRGRRERDELDEMEPVLPGSKDKQDKDEKKRNKGKKNKQPLEETQPAETRPAEKPPAGTVEEKSAEKAATEPAAKPEGKPDPQAIEPGKESKPEPKLEAGKQAELNSRGQSRKEQKQSPAGTTGESDKPDTINADADASASNEDAPAQAHELLSIKVAQKYFFDRDFGGALIEGQRNQFYPINTLSGFTFGGRARSLSPVNVAVRYRPLSSIYGDLRMDIGSDDNAVRNMKLSGGLTKERFSISASWYLSRRIEFDPNSFEPGTFPGNQIFATFQFGDDLSGLYGGTRIGYDLTDRFIGDELSHGRLRNSRSYLGYAFDCCGLQFNYNTFKAGLRNESAFSFTFTLAGLGSFGTDQISQLGGGRGARRRGKRARRNRDRDDDLP